jgi:predicted Fe-Mo cluster-binding NifX family protein
MLYKAAVASVGGKFVDRHFGRCDKFIIAEINTESGEIRYLEPLFIEEPLCGSGHDAESLEAAYLLFCDCKFIIASRAGLAVKERFYSKGLIILEDDSEVENALKKLIKHLSAAERNGGII